MIKNFPQNKGYNMIVEGVLAETGYHAFFTMLQRNHLIASNRRSGPLCIFQAGVSGMTQP